ncbi:helix-turn-helix domain-containing protein [Ruminococcaceae bacterium OttesenSCG-928-I18]|nr:helix-turn-helix domain-containing protein [Ruminococcaceae bacterium OttesenSCG-928-I18]
MTESQKEQIVAMRGQGIGYVKIGQALGISNNTVRSFCRRNGLEGSRIKDTITCKQCGKKIKIIPKRKPKKFCSDTCRTAWWNSHLECATKKAVYQFTCLCCGKAFEAYGNQNRKYCCHKCYIADRFGGEHACHE